MAYPVYSTRFMKGQASTGSTVDSYTVPSGKVAVVKCVTFVDASAGGAGAVAALTIPGPTFVVVGGPIAAVPYLATELTIVVNAGEAITVFRASGSVFWSVSGFLLDSP